MEEKSFLYSKRQWWGYLHFGDKNISIQLFWLAACREVTNPCKISQLNFCGCRWDHIHARLPNTSQFHGGKIPLSRTKSTKQSLIWSFHKWLQLYTFLFCFHFGSPQLGSKLDYWLRESTSRGVRWLSLALLSLPLVQYWSNQNCKSSYCYCQEQLFVSSWLRPLWLCCCRSSITEIHNLTR
jgi:hypothetical protein